MPDDQNHGGRPARTGKPAPHDVHARLTEDEYAVMQEAVATSRTRTGNPRYSGSDLLRRGAQVVVEGLGLKWPGASA